MKKWADYLISEVSYDSEHLISVVTRHQDTDQGITKGEPTDRLTIASDIKNGLSYITIHSGKNSWTKGFKLQTFSIGGNPYLRIDENKVKLDYLGDLLESSFAKFIPIQELELQPEPITELEPPSSPRGSLPKESAEELPQELELQPEPITELEEEATTEQLVQLDDLQQQIDDLENILSTQTFSKSTSEEEATPEQLAQLDDLQQQIDDLENILSNQLASESHQKATPEQLSKVKKLEKEIAKLEAIDIEHEIIPSLQKQNKKLDYIENKLKGSKKIKRDSSKSNLSLVYCVKCKTKRKIKNPKDAIMKNGRPAIKGTCSVCKSKVFRIVKMKK